MKGHLVNREFNGLIEARDRNLRFDFRGLLDLNDEQRPRYDFALDLEEANLAALGVNRRDSVSVLAARIAARAVGRTLDDLNGIIFVRDVSYRYNDRELAADSVVIVGRNSLSDKFIRLRSDFVDADYEGKTSYKEVFAYLQQRFRDYVPTLDGGPGWQAQHPDTVELADGYSQLTVNVRKINPLVNAVSPGLQIADGSRLLLRINPANDKLSFEAASDYIERGRMLVTRLNLDAHNRGDSLVFAASTEDLYLNSFHMSRVGMSGGAKDNKLEADYRFRGYYRRCFRTDRIPFGICPGTRSCGPADRSAADAVVHQPGREDLEYLYGRYYGRYFPDTNRPFSNGQCRAATAARRRRIASFAGFGAIDAA